MAKYFVYVQGLRGVEPQLWSEKDMTTDQKPIKYLACHAVEDSATLDECVAKFPYEAKS